MTFAWQCDRCHDGWPFEAVDFDDAVNTAGNLHEYHHPDCLGNVSLVPTPMATASPQDHDPVNSPQHYRSHPSGIQCIEVVEHYDFVIGNIVKYAWRAGLKDGASKLQDLRKCAWYATRAVEREEAKTRKTPENQGVSS